LSSSKNITGINKPERIKYMRQQKMLEIKEIDRKTWLVNLTGKNHFKELGTNGRVTLKGILRKGITSTTYLVAGKGKVVSAHAMNAHRGSGGIAPLILNLGTRWM
jgi:hypothetical protein